MRPQLFLLEPSFSDPAVGPGTFFCPHCAVVEGLLSYSPALRERLDVTYVRFERPRPEVVAVLGVAHQACPVLVLPEGAPTPAAPSRTANDRTFFVGATEIAAFLSEWASIGRPHP
ncbi:MAG: DUF3088 domain-containing protein [Myxococcaceae bacterium]|jgi:hypothetical protein|nr:DUF3088 domain-containing protein [Myxococcaceae bacterium]MCA3016793.1 DUF3088 domain-containing protein [Myxococcaceae bacterium]